MAGHSKWANIKHRKGRQDAKRGKIFTKLIRELVEDKMYPLTLQGLEDGMKYLSK